MDNTKLKNRMSSKIQTLQMPVEVIEVAETEMVPVKSDYLALNNNALDIIKENLKHQPLSFQLFDIVKSPSGGSTVFSVPGLTGEEAEKELLGIVLDYMTPRAYWSTPDPVEGTPPDCLSHDSIMSCDGKICARCPYNDYGSKDGETNAKACKESVLLFLLRQDNILPLLVRMPVTSKFRFLKYMTRLIGTMTPVTGVVTRITLEKATSKTGKPFALFNFDAVSLLSPEETAMAKAFGQQFMENVNFNEMVPDPDVT